MRNKQFYVELPTEKIGDKIIQSSFRKARSSEVKYAKKHFEKTGQCFHPVFYDEGSWMYDYRYCGVCGKLIGLI